MRPKIVIIIVLAGLVCVTGILLIKHRGTTPQAPVPTAIAETKPAAPQTAPAVTEVPPPAPAPAAAAPVATASVATNALTTEQHEAAVEAEMDRLQQWSMNDDSASLSNILADLTNPDKEIRKAAIEAAEQFGSTNAIPTLKALAAQTIDPEEKQALLEAADFIALPSIFEVGKTIQRTPEQIQAAAQQKAERDARRQARKQNPAAGQNSTTAPNP